MSRVSYSLTVRPACSSPGPRVSRMRPLSTPCRLMSSSQRSNTPKRGSLRLTDSTACADIGTVTRSRATSSSAL